MICGGLVAAIIAVISGFRATHLDPRVAGYLACGGGGALGGLFAGRASNHFSILEPAIAGAMVIGSVFALIKYTAIGPLAFTFAEDAIVRESLILGGLASGGGLVGAIIGELSATGGPSHNRLRWLGLGVFLTAGALLFTIIVTQFVLVDRTLRDSQLMTKLWQESPILTGDEVVVAVLAALAGAGFIGGLVTQLAAPTRMILVVLAGVFIAITGALIGLFVLGDALDQGVALGAVIAGGAATIPALPGALLGWLLGGPRPGPSELA